MGNMYVSVILTVYNERWSIGRLLDSLASQTYHPDEIVICDGGSTDGNVAAIQNYIDHDPDRFPHLHLLVEPGRQYQPGS